MIAFLVSRGVDTLNKAAYAVGTLRTPRKDALWKDSDFGAVVGFRV